MIFGNKSATFNPGQDIPDLSGKVILVTGGNAGLGKQCVLEFSRHSPAQIWLAARSPEKAQAASDEIRQKVPGAPIKLLQLDTASFESVKKAAARVLAESGRLDILMLNAGIMAAPAGLTRDGYELHFGTNHMGHALLTKLLTPLLENTAREGSDVRVVCVSSHGHTYAAEGSPRYETLKTEAEELGAYGRYFQSKLANVLFARQLAKEHPTLTTVSLDPGIVSTNLMAGTTGSYWLLRAVGQIANRWLVTSVETGARNHLWASVSKDVKSGEFYGPVGVHGAASKDGQDDALAKELWDWTENELQGHVA